MPSATSATRPRAPRASSRVAFPGTHAAEVLRRLAQSLSSMRSNWLYFATRSLRARRAGLDLTAVGRDRRSAMVVSSVSPLRCDITDV